MAARMLVLFFGIVLFFCTQRTTADVPPPTWPKRLYALLVHDFSGELAVMDLWFDGAKSGNSHIIQEQVVSPYHDMQWNNANSSFWGEEAKTCRTAAGGVGILRPSWHHFADVVGVIEISGFTCDVFNKLDFLIYCEDDVTGKPVYWKYYTGRQVHVITFEEGVALSDENWKAPKYCFSDEQTIIILPHISLSHIKSKSPQLTEYKEWVLSGAMSA